MIGGNAVELEVDTETGHVRLTKLITVADGGTLLNPKIAVTQLSGAAIMQIGYALFERMEMDHGQCTDASLADYKIPGIHDVPAMESCLSKPPRRMRRSALRVSAIRLLRRGARDRQCDPRCGRCPADGPADDAGGCADRDLQGRQPPLRRSVS